MLRPRSTVARQRWHEMGRSPVFCDGQLLRSWITGQRHAEPTSNRAVIHIRVATEVTTLVKAMSALSFLVQPCQVGDAEKDWINVAVKNALLIVLDPSIINSCLPHHIVQCDD